MIPDLWKTAIVAGCVGHFCWGALFLLFLTLSAFFSRKYPVPPVRRE